MQALKAVAPQPVASGAFAGNPAAYGYMPVRFLDLLMTMTLNCSSAAPGVLNLEHYVRRATCTLEDNIQWRLQWATCHTRLLRFVYVTLQESRQIHFMSVRYAALGATSQRFAL